MRSMRGGYEAAAAAHATTKKGGQKEDEEKQVSLVSCGLIDVTDTVNDFTPTLQHYCCSTTS